MQNNNNMDLSRLEILFGEDVIKTLQNSSVAIIGLGGVGGICAECIVRCGVGRVAICDGDVVDSSNVNRQIVATSSTIGKNKAIELKKRLLDINPDLSLQIHEDFWTKETDFILEGEYDYVIDAIDSVSHKLDLIEMCKTKNINIVSSMGAGLRHKSNMFCIDDIYKTYNDPLAKKMRYELKKRNINSLDVVFSKEKPQKATGEIGSVMYTVASCGLLLASHVVDTITNNRKI